MIRQINDDVSVGGQVTSGNLAEFIELGFRSIVNNRPDFEMPGQPSHDELKSEVEKAGLAYAYIPMNGPISPDMIEASTKAYADLPKPIYAFCASGTRSAALWAFAKVGEFGVDGVLASVSQAGYHLEQIRPGLESLVKNPQ